MKNLSYACCKAQGEVFVALVQLPDFHSSIIRIAQCDEHGASGVETKEILKNSQKCDMVLNIIGGGIIMAVSYKRLLHMMIERDISNTQLMRDAQISANIITKLKNGQYIALDKVESICGALGCTPNEILEFVPDTPTNGGKENG